MSSRSEIGHNQNVANFEDLISRCSGFGANYNPNFNAIKLGNLNTLRANALNTLSATSAAKMAYESAVNDREIVFKPLKKLATRIMNALKASGVSELVIKDARSINYKIQGVRVKAIPENETEAEKAKHISVSRQSFNSMMEHYSRLIDLLGSIPDYQPNEAELSVTGLNTLLSNMKASNTAVINTTTTMLNAIIERNLLLYNKENGLVLIANEVKFYVKSVFGTTSQEYKEVRTIKFTRRKIN